MSTILQGGKPNGKTEVAIETASRCMTWRKFITTICLDGWFTFLFVSSCRTTAWPLRASTGPLATKEQRPRSLCTWPTTPTDRGSLSHTSSTFHPATSSPPPPPPPHQNPALSPHLEFKTNQMYLNCKKKPSSLTRGWW